jgi:hypothetical protein
MPQEEKLCLSRSDARQHGPDTALLLIGGKQLVRLVGPAGPGEPSLIPVLPGTPA